MRAILAGSNCVSPATVFDALSARVAQRVGYEVAVLSGSVCAATLLAAPDVMVHTLTEFADQVRRVMRVSTLSLLLDADHGYGNALNTMRTVEELEHAGAAAIVIEDTVMPPRFGSASLEVISSAEMVGKLRAALAVRQDPSLLIVGRIAALKAEDTRRAVERAVAYAATGIDALFITGLTSLAEFDAIRTAVRLPIIVGLAPAVKREDLAARGVRLLLQGHQPVPAVIKTLRDVYSHLYHGGTPAELKPLLATSEEMEQVLGVAQYEEWRRQYLA
jgi:carboxyvinyl-carboxyphosphonate phosphorylmutase